MDQAVVNRGQKKQRKLGDQPCIHESAVVTDSRLGAWTEVGARTRMAETGMGDYSYVVEDCHIIYTAIGKFCSIAANVRINPGNHPSWRACQHHWMYRADAYGLGEDEVEFFQWRRDHHVAVGHDVWIGHGAIVLPGRTVGTGAVIGAGSVVTKDVPNYTIVAGNPARPIRRRVDETTEAALLEMAWWDWPRDRLAAALPDFRSLDAAGFVAKHAAG